MKSNMDDIKKRLSELTDKLNDYAYRYYVLDDPVVTDDVYDRMYDELVLLEKQSGVEATLINPRYISGIDEALMESLKANHELVVTLEDGVLDGGFGEKIARYFGNSPMKVLNFGARKEFVDRFDSKETTFNPQWKR